MKNSRTNREMFIGLIAPIGVDLNSVQAALERALVSVKYDAAPIRLTDSLKPSYEELRSKGVGLFERYGSLISTGNTLRDERGSDVFALIAIHQVQQLRSAEGVKISDRRAFILRQFKRTEEIDLLKDVYGSNIIFLSCHAPRPVRIKYFVEQLMSESRAKSRTFYEAQALELIAKDEHESDDPNGQRLLDTYARADFVLDCSTPQALTISCERFIEAFFGHPFISPTRDEYGAFIANSASLRSTDLSRQVGAAIFQAGGEIVSLGCNEVPKAGGGTYWTGDPNDSRDFRLGHDSNVRIKNDLIHDTLTRLRAAGWKPDTNSSEGALDDGMIQDLLEFGRVIHAEMNAITDASRFGRSTAGGTLYCTTLPCHMCSRHIVAAGISRVVYLQPYHKSLARELYADSIVFEDADVASTHRVIFSSFWGVTPKSFQTVFSKARRKDGSGVAIQWRLTDAVPITLSSPEYLDLEALALTQFEQKSLAPAGPDIAQ